MRLMKDRIIGFDIARALAILGMMFVNYKIVFTSNAISNTFLSAFITMFEGRAAAVFLLLAGIGISLMTKKAYEAKDLSLRMKLRYILIKRSAFLLLLGAFLMIVFEWSADILHYYAVYIMLITLVLYWAPKKLYILSWGICFISFIMQHVLSYEMNWDAGFETYNNMNSVIGITLNTFFNGYHPVLPWIVFMIIGLAIGRLDFNDKRVVNRIIGLGIAMAVITESISHELITSTGFNEYVIYLVDTKPMNPSSFYVIAATGWALFFIGMCVKLSIRFKESRLLKTLAVTGQMSLTHYVVHCALVIPAFFIIDGLAVKSELFVILLSLLVFIGMMIYSYYQDKRGERGHLEKLMRKVSA